MPPEHGIDRRPVCINNPPHYICGLSEAQPFCCCFGRILFNQDIISINISFKKYYPARNCNSRCATHGNLLPRNATVICHKMICCVPVILSMIVYTSIEQCKRGWYQKVKIVYKIEQFKIVTKFMLCDQLYTSVCYYLSDMRTQTCAWDNLKSKRIID